MLANWLLDNRWFGPTVMILIVVAGPFFSGWLAGRRPLAWVLTWVATAGVALFTLAPSTVRARDSWCTVQWSWPTFGTVELMANVLLFAVPALLAAVASRRPWLVLAVATVFSALVEVTQATIPVIGRSCDTNDWMSNTLGAALGVALAAFGLHLHRRTSMRRSPPGV